MFVLDEKVVYPGHGVAKISRIIEKIIAAQKTTFFELKFLNKDMTILVPTDNLSSVGLRRLSSPDCINEILKFLSDPIFPTQADSNGSNWNKRNKDYQCKLRTGNLRDICKIYRDLKCISLYKELSFGEKSLLQQTEMLLAQEISLVKKEAEEAILEKLRSFFVPKLQHMPSQSFTQL